VSIVPIIDGEYEEPGANTRCVRCGCVWRNRTRVDAAGCDYCRGRKVTHPDVPRDFDDDVDLASALMIALGMFSMFESLKYRGADGLPLALEPPVDPQGP